MWLRDKLIENALMNWNEVFDNDDDYENMHNA